MKFSIVIPVYNVAPYLKDCLDSVFAAAHRLMSPDKPSTSNPQSSVEVICVDDGSTDGSGKLLDTYHESHLRVIHQPNAGVSAARNRGLERTTGDWILFVDADDFVRETWLEDILGMIVRHPDADLVGFGKLPYFGQGEWGESAVAERDVGIEDRIDDVLVGFCVYQFAYSSSLIRNTRFRPLSVGEDLVFVSEALARSQRCVISDRREYGYRYREGSASHEDISSGKMCDIISFNRAMFAVLSVCGKRIGDAFTRGRGNEWFATLPQIILSHRKDPDWRPVWERWLDSMRDFSALACFPEWQRRQAAKISGARTRFVVWTYCIFLWRLKRKFS